MSAALDTLVAELRELCDQTTHTTDTGGYDAVCTAGVRDILDRAVRCASERRNGPEGA